MLDGFSLIVGCLCFYVINVFGDLLLFFESFLFCRCHVGMTHAQFVSFRKFLKDCYDISYFKFCSLDSKDQVSILSTFFGIDAMH